MKNIIFGAFVILLSVALISFTNSQKGFVTFACEWFRFDDNSATNPGATGNADGIATYTEALNQLNYRKITAITVQVLCPYTDKLCAVCANQVTVNGVPHPDLSSGQTIKTTVDKYYGVGASAQDPCAVDYPGQIAEFNNCTFKAKL